MPAATEHDLHIIEPICAVFRRRLRDEGLKYTAERARILDAVIRQSSIFVPEGLLADLRRDHARVSKATVYRTLRLLQDAGIIQRIPSDDDQAHYLFAYGHSSTDLVIRLDTTAAIPIHVPQLAALRDDLCRSLGLQPIGHRLYIYAAAQPAATPARH